MNDEYEKLPEGYRGMRSNPVLLPEGYHGRWNELTLEDFKFLFQCGISMGLI